MLFSINFVCISYVTYIIDTNTVSQNQIDLGLHCILPGNNLENTWKFVLPEMWEGTLYAHVHETALGSIYHISDSLRNQGTILWAALPNACKEAKDISTFKLIGCRFYLVVTCLNLHSLHFKCTALFPYSLFNFGLIMFFM